MAGNGEGWLKGTPCPAAPRIIVFGTPRSQFSRRDRANGPFPLFSATKARTAAGSRSILRGESAPVAPSRFRHDQHIVTVNPPDE